MWASAGTAGNGGESMCPCRMSHAPRYYLGERGELGGLTCTTCLRVFR